ncbi:hypothetical protein BGZ61DRAFT_493214 [Ilyonectria robusta]|uniref:uncharacterized protein n=1 Tax=Ilyonectria robusta TaxID=1079257 RepID=UPI001E8CD083|nr:uncharacterized protein BGZ61DRAFT_493214 [Ilyonectria robusta]KAH8706253.1 hypothetical protein BGZ61DRAFT_493214 [Ilyonectria robusta]
MPLYQGDMCLLSGPSSQYNDPTPTGQRQAVTSRSIYPLTKSQEGMWVDFQTDPFSTKYNLTLEWDILHNRSGPKPTIDELLHVITKLTARHATLRSMFTLIDGKPNMEEYTVDDVNPEIRIVYREDSAIEERTMTQILRRPFALQHELPARWVILQDPEVFRVYITCHHIVVDGQSMTNISGEFVELLDNPETTLSPVVPFHTMHMIERARARSQAYIDNQSVLLNQALNQNNSLWPKSLSNSSVSNENYRHIDSWCDLDNWSQLFKTSWFRVATSLVGLLVIDKTRPQFGRDESLVSAVGKNISAVKRAELFPAVEVVRSCRNLNIDYIPPKVAVTYSPKLAKSGCRLFPVEGSWDLFFCFLEYENDVKLGVIYNPKVFSGTAVANMKTQFDSLCALSKVQGTKLTEMLKWLPEHSNLPKQPTEMQSNPLVHVHHWIDAHAETRPEAMALLSSELGKSMTYGELYASSEEKAKFLRRRNISRGDKVLIHLHRGFAVIEWILAILKCGAIFVYLDPDFTQRQQTSVMANCKPKLVIDETSVNEEIPSEANDTAVSQDEIKFTTADADIAYIIYTSGSTGEPKGVMIEHGSLAAFVRASTDVFEVGFGTRVLQLASFSFDASILEWSNALCTGACLCFAQYPKQLNSVTFMQITPTALETLPLDIELPSLRQISIGGEAPSHEIFAKWQPRINLVNAYGPTEAAIAVSFNKIDKSKELPEVISAGRPNPQVGIHICAEGFGRILGPGLEGEICVSGPQIARGYCEKPEITAKSFATHGSSILMYRTGDRGMLQDDGTLLVMGRIDRELKVRGFRIAPEEVESAILDATLGVKETSVQISENGLELLAFVAPIGISSTNLLNALKKVLPSHKIPSRIHVLDSLPKNVNGKIDHKAIRSMREKLTRSNILEDGEFLESGSELEIEETDISDPAEDERVVAKIWQEVLRMQSRPPVDVNFFDIGGHSLLVPKLHDQLKASFPSKAVRLVELFHKSTIRSQALLFGEKKKKSRVFRRAVKTASSVGSLSDQTPLSTRSTATSVSDMPHGHEVAIVGIAGRFPGAKNVNEFYQILMDGKSGLQSDRDCTERKLLPGNVWVQRAGVLDDIEDFDNEFWNLSEEEATEMDPQQRLFMEVAYEALVDAGADLQNLPGGRIGIFVGSANHAYHLHTESVATDTFLRQNRGFVAPSISARTAYHLNIRGPNVTIQTNCASSTVALSQAFDAIRLGRCDMAIVGGVSVQLYEGGYITQQGQIFSPRGECNPFDSRADGTVPADAVTAVVLQRYSATTSDGTTAYAKILGTGVGSDGALDKAGYQVPSPRGQADVIKSAWDVAQITPEKLKYAEIHGSGTPIGDALELEGLSLAVKELGGSGHHFTVGSTKGNIGNTQHSSGLVSLIKLCKSMQAGVVPATMGLEQPNQMINPDLPIILATKQTKLEPDDILAVSAAGWGGVNSHIVLGFPDQHLLKKSTTLVSESMFNRRSLRAPRLRPMSNEEQRESSLAVLVFTKCASEVLGVEAMSDTDLKMHGLDSKSYLEFMGTASKQLSGPMVGVRGMLLSKCTPSALANIYQDQLRASESADVSSTIVQRGNGVTLVFLPGSEGSSVSAIPLLENLHKGVTILALEHQGKDATSTHVEAYLEAVQPHIGSENLVVVGMSLGGLSALRLTVLLAEFAGVSADSISLIALDSPPISSLSALDQDVISRLNTVVYISAVGGKSDRNLAAEARWQDLAPATKTHKLDCEHFELWGKSHAAKTAGIINSVIKDILQK